MTHKDLPTLSPRQAAVLELLANGYGKRQVATKLRIGERTVDRTIAQAAEQLAIIDPRLAEDLGTVGRIARIVALYTEFYAKPKANLQNSDRDATPLLRLAVRSELDIASDRIQNETQVSVQCLQDEVMQTAHGIIIDDRSPRASVFPKSLEVWSHSPRVKVTHELLVQDEKRPLFQVKFDPPLTQGQRLVYHYSQVTDNYFPMTQADLAMRIANGTYPLKEAFCEKSYSINTPTDHLYLRLNFPTGFAIANECVIVEIGRGGSRDRAEEERIQQCSGFEKTLFARRMSLVLALENPVLLRRYRIRWQPSH
ncbi:LuxR C-terminal-related transcriptional regulator [Tumidithrix elongata RA019]|uniref:LuxR C-terminal-related transcriptional regulator n=1 Tax=Tumidithrix elongata BACA0141 TaxID=2716417 RepID=A0AAW9QC90_9CYAN|nr:LuxR C-terminal-related transcriptional regulator [Tumidithrix elongata RA019]